MISARIFFARLNEQRSGQWVSNSDLLKGAEEYFKANGFSKIERDQDFGHGFISPIVGYKAEEKMRLATFFNPRIDRYEMSFFGALESALYRIVDEDSEEELSTLMLATDSLSYSSITKIEEISVNFENLMNEGLTVLFVNNRAAYAMYEKYHDLLKPVPVEY